MPELILNRNYTLTTTKGHSVVFMKDEPTFVPNVIYQEAIAIGAQPADGTDPDVLKDEVKDNTPADPADRAPMILAAIEALIARNDREDFTAAGTPTAAAVSKEVGFKVQNKEIAPVMQQYHDNKAAQ